jgi:hypothetical protein
MRLELTSRVERAWQIFAAKICIKWVLAQHLELTSAGLDFRNTLPNARCHGERFRLFGGTSPDNRSGNSP